MPKTLKYERQKLKVVHLPNKALSWAGVWENGATILPIRTIKTKVAVCNVILYFHYPWDRRMEGLQFWSGRCGKKYNKPYNDVSVNDGPHIRRWSHKIIIL